MKRYVHVVVAVAGCWVGGGTVAAAVVEEIDLAGIGTGLPIDSFDFSMAGYPSGHSNAGGGRTSHPTLSDLVITRQLDAASPKLAEAAVMAKVFDEVEIRLCKENCTSPSSYMQVNLKTVLISSYMPGGASDPIPTESITMNYSKMNLSYSPAPMPPQTAWSVIMPSSLPVGGAEPYDFDFRLDAATVESLFERPLSPLGDGLPPTLFNTSAVPEPAATWLVASGLLAAAAGLRGGRGSRS